MSSVLTREQMYELVWSIPMRHAATRFGISDVALRKRCLLLDVPTPPAGHWAKVSANKSISRPPLPQRQPGMSEFVGNRQQQLEARQEMAGGPGHTGLKLIDTLAALRHTLLAACERLDVRLDHTHPRVRARLAPEGKRRGRIVEQRSPISPDRSFIDNPLEQRRFRLVNALFYACQSMGARPSIVGRRARDLSFAINIVTVSVHIAVLNKTDDEADEWFRRPGTAANRLRLTIRNPGGRDAHWTDDDETLIEANVRQIVAEIFVQAERSYRTSRDRQVDRIRVLKAARDSAMLAEQERERVAAADRRLREEQQRIDRLVAEAEAYKRASLIREYVSAVRNNARSNDGVDQWAAWATAVADTIEPIRG